MPRKSELKAWAHEARHAYNEGILMGQDKTYVPKNVPNSRSAEACFTRGVKDATRKTNPVRSTGGWVEIPIDLWQEVLARKQKPGWW